MVYSCGLLSRRQRVRVPPSPRFKLYVYEKGYYEKDDLRTGMRVVTKSRHSYIFIRGFVHSSIASTVDILIPLQEDAPYGVLFLEYYDDNLKRIEKSRQENNIEEIWESDSAERIAQIPDPSKDTLLWARNMLEVTLEDVAKKFNVDVNHIKIVEK